MTSLRGELDVQQVNLQRIADLLHIEIEAMRTAHERLSQKLETLEARLKRLEERLKRLEERQP